MNSFIGIAGNIGVGKTTFTELVAEHFGITSYFESVIDNPYLEDFYGNMDLWSFQLQIYFLHHRFRTHMAMSENSGGTVQDRTIYEDVEIFARNLHEMGYMSNRDWDNYRELFAMMTSFLRKPDLIIYLQASTDTLLSRIRGRGRDFERSINAEYLHSLNVAYERWIGSIQDTEPVMLIDTNRLNVLTDKLAVAELLEEIGQRLSVRQTSAREV